MVVPTSLIGSERQQYSCLKNLRTLLFPTLLFHSSCPHSQEQKWNKGRSSTNASPRHISQTHRSQYRKQPHKIPYVSKKRKPLKPRKPRWVFYHKSKNWRPISLPRRGSYWKPENLVKYFSPNPKIDNLSLFLDRQCFLSSL